MPLDAIAGLITAVFDLQAVRAVTRAANANLPKDGPLGTSRPSAATLRHHGYDATNRSYDRYVPNAGYVERPDGLSGPIFDYYDRFGCPCRHDDCGRGMPVEPAGPWVLDGPTPSPGPGPLDPPWKHLPPVRECETVIEVNLVRPKVDAIAKGTLLDLFA